MRRALLALTLASASLAWAGPSWAEEGTAAAAPAPAPEPAPAPAAATGLRLRTPLFVYFGSDPLKILAMGGAHLRDVYRADPSPVFDGAYLDGGLDVILTPSNPGFRAHVEWMPIAPVVLKLNHSALWYTAFPRGSGHGLSFARTDSDFSQAVLQARSGEEESLWAQRTVATLVLRAKAWRISGQNETELAGWWVPAGKGLAWYEMAYDLLILRGRYDWTFMDRLVLLFEVWKMEPGWSLSVGAVNEYVRALGTHMERDRVGGAVVFNPGAKLLGAQAPSVVLMAGGTAVHPNRVGSFWAHVVLSAAWEPWAAGP
ncbi:MAG TPA: hypothetical protein VGK67_06555 [Myxococcales bacterium]|jgi:hypothetical protein